MEICFGKGRKHCGERRKCWLPSFSPFPTVFSKGFFYRVVKSRDCVVKKFTKHNTCAWSLGKWEKDPNNGYFRDAYFIKGSAKQVVKKKDQTARFV